MCNYGAQTFFCEYAHRKDTHERLFPLATPELMMAVQPRHARWHSIPETDL